MSDFKALYDRVVSAQTAVQVIVNQIDAAMQLGTPEGVEEALALEPQLDGAIATQDQALKFYDKVRNAHKSSNLAVNFVPVSETPTTPDPEKPKGVMKRGEFNALAQNARAAFIRGGGTIEDEEEVKHG